MLDDVVRKNSELVSQSLELGTKLEHVFNIKDTITQVGTDPRSWEMSFYIWRILTIYLHCLAFSYLFAWVNLTLMSFSGRLEFIFIWL